MQKRPAQKVAPKKLKAELPTVISKPAVGRSRSARLKQSVEVQQQAHELLDKLAAARNSQQLRKNFDAAAVQKIKRLTQLLDRLRTTPQRNLVLQRQMTAGQYADYLEQLKQPRYIADILLQDGLPDVLVHYQTLINAADKLNALAEGAATRKRRSRSGKSSYAHRNKAQSIYEQACIYLDEQLVVVDPMTEQQIRAWLDRDFDFSTDGEIAIDCMGVARVRGSRSKYSQSNTVNTSAERKNTTHQCQITAVTAALQQQIYEPEPFVETKLPVFANNLRSKMANLNPEKD